MVGQKEREKEGRKQAGKSMNEGGKEEMKKRKQKGKEGARDYLFYWTSFSKFCFK